MNKGLAYRFIEHHLAALKEGAIPSRLSCRGDNEAKFVA